MARELGRLDQLQRIDHDHRGERRLWHQRDDRPEQQQRRQGRAAAVTIAATCDARARQPVDGGLRRAATGRHRTQHATGDIRQAEREQFLVGLGTRLARRRRTRAPRRCSR